MTDLHALIEELEKAKEGSHSLDAAIVKAIELPGVHCPAYTTSLDAALQLVPEGWIVSFVKFTDGSADAGVGDPDPNGASVIMRGGATPALALVTAVLKARAE